MTSVCNDTHICMLPLGAPPPGFNKLERLKPDHLVAKRHNHDTPVHPGQKTTLQIQDDPNPHLAPKVADWKKIAYTDGICIRHDCQQIIGAGAFIPDTNRIHRANLNGFNSRLLFCFHRCGQCWQTPYARSLNTCNSRIQSSSCMIFCYKPQSKRRTHFSPWCHYNNSKQNAQHIKINRTIPLIKA